MDFHSLARRDLQFLCKKNRIPANQTNIAMASALQALETVEGIEEIQAALGFQSPKKPEAKSPELPRTSRRTSVRRSIHGDEPKIQEQPASSLHQPRRVTVKTLEVIEMASKEEEGEKKEAPKHFPKTPATTRRTSRGQVAPSSMGKANQEDDASNVTPTPVHTGRTRQVRRVAAETPKVAEAKEGKNIRVMTRRSTLLSSRKAGETATTKAESRSSSSRAKEAVKMAALAKEGEEEQEMVEEKKDSAENGDSTDILVEDAGKKDQDVKSHGISSSLDVENSVEALESPEEEEVGENNQEIESRGLSSLLGPEKEEDAGKELVDTSLLEKSSIMTPLSGEIGSPEENSTEMKESNISNEQTPKDESSGAKVTISVDTQVLLSCGVGKEKEGKKLSLLFTEMTMKEAAESGDVPEAGIVQDASSISKNSNSETDFVEDVTNRDGCSSETSYIELPKEAEEYIYSPPAVVAPEDAPLDSKNLDAVRDLCDEPLTTEGVGVSFAFASESPNKFKEIAGDHTREILVVAEESIDRDLQDAAELEVPVEMLHETVTLQDDTGEILEVPPLEAGELAAMEFVDVPPRGSEDASIDRVIQDASKLEMPVEMIQKEVEETGGNLTGEILEVPPQETCELAVDEGKETSGEFPIKIAAVIAEPTESMQDASCECVEFSAAENSSAVIITETLPETKEGEDDHFTTSEFNGDERDMCSNETMALSEFSIVQIQPTDSEVADLAAGEMAEEKEDIKAVEKQETFEDENIAAELGSKQKQGGSKNEMVEEDKAAGKDKSVNDENLVDLSLTKLRAMYKQKLDDRKSEVTKQENLQCMSHSKLYANSTQKLNEYRNKLGKRTPLKNLN